MLKHVDLRYLFGIKVGQYEVSFFHSSLEQSSCVMPLIDREETHRQPQQGICFGSSEKKMHILPEGGRASAEG